MSHRRFTSSILLGLLAVFTLLLPSAAAGRDQAGLGEPGGHQLYLPLVTTVKRQPAGPPAVMGSEAPLPADRRDLLRNLGLQPWDRFAGDPVSVVSGNHIQQFSDLQVPGIAGLDWELQRTYNSMDDRDGFFGVGWSSLLDMQLRLADDGSVDVRYPDGSGVFFLRQGSDFIPGQGGVFDQLAGSGNDFVLTTHDQLRYHFTQRNSVAWLMDLQDRHGNEIRLDRNIDGQPQQLVDSAGRVFTFDYTGTHISRVTDPLGQALTYAYDVDGNLISVTDARGGVHQFTYEQGPLTTLTDPEGIRYLENIYDGQGRVVEQIDASDQHSFFAYDDAAGETRFTDKLGYQTVYRYDGLGRVLAIVDPLGHGETYGYDDDYNVVSATNKLGHSWTYTFDGRGNQLTARNPFGFVTSNSYNLTNDVTGFSDNGGFDGQARTTAYQYDVQGNLTAIVWPDGSSLLATYDAAGQLLTVTDAKGQTSSYTYDSHGNLATMTDPLGQVTTHTYDLLGRRQNTTNASGYSTSFSYDSGNNLIEMVDARGHTEQFIYDLNGQLVQHVDRLGGVTLYEYDLHGRLVAVTDPGGHTIRYAYDALDNRSSLTDAKGQATQYRYDPLSRLVEEETPLGEVSQWSYDAYGNLTSQIDPLGQTTSFEYDALNQRRVITDALGGRTRYFYDEVGRVTRMIDPMDHSVVYLYDLLDRPHTVIDALGGEQRTTYDAMGNPITRIDAAGRSTSYAYDALNRVIAITDPAGHATTFEYDGLGNLTRLEDAAGAATRYEYDENGNRIKIIDALGGSSQFAYDDADRLVAQTDANGQTKQYALDPDGLLVSLTESGGQTTTFAYDAVHNQVQRTDALGNQWLTSYDALNRPTSRTNPLGHSIQHTYDPLGRLSQLIDANGVVTGYGYDALGRLTAVTQNERPGQPADAETNVATSYTYDALGNLLSVLDAQGGSSSFTYDALSRLVQENDPLGQSWSYEYDAVGNLIRRTDARGQATTYTYDDDDLLLAMAFADGSSTTFAYDAVHNQVEMTDALGSSSRTYDPLRRLMSSSNHLGQSLQYSYDAVGNRIALQYPDGQTVQYAYDADNFISAVNEPGGGQFQVTRDAAHQITSILYPNQTTAAYTWDPAQRLTAVSHTDPNGQILSRFDYLLDPQGNRLQLTENYGWRQPPQLTTDYQYDSLYRLVHSADNEGRFASYTYDAVGNRLQLVTNDDVATAAANTALTTRYRYNQAHQLVALTTEGAVSESAIARWTKQLNNALRPFSNEVKAQTGRHIETTTALALRQQADDLRQRLASKPAPSQAEVTTALAALVQAVTDAGQTGLIDNHGIVNSLLVKLRRAREANGQLEQLLVSTSFTYDENGNRTERLTTESVGSQSQGWQRTDYSFNAQNRLQQVQSFFDADGSGGWQALAETQLTYDGYGRLFRRQFDDLAGGSSSQWAYVYDGLDPIAQYLDQTHHNLYRGLERLLSLDDGLGLGAASRYYYHHDGLGSISALSDSLGQSRHNYRYQDFGLILDVNGLAAGSSSFNTPPNRYSYTGQEWDENLGLYHFYAREYEPATGTWLQPDPYRGRLAQPLTLHRYNYVGNNPITFADFYGFDRDRSSPELGLFTSRAMRPMLPLLAPPPPPSSYLAGSREVMARAQRAALDRPQRLFDDLFAVPLTGRFTGLEQRLAEVVYGQALAGGAPQLSRLEVAVNGWR